jgi:hypothetical protein
MDVRQTLLGYLSVTFGKNKKKRQKMMRMSYEEELEMTMSCFLL